MGKSNTFSWLVWEQSIDIWLLFDWEVEAGGWGGGTLGLLGGNGGGCDGFFLGGFSISFSFLISLFTLFLFDDNIVVANRGGTGGGGPFLFPCMPLWFIVDIVLLTTSSLCFLIHDDDGDVYVYDFSCFFLIPFQMI